MIHRRIARLNEQLKRDISLILARKVRDPRVGQVLVTEARVTTDHSLVRVFVRPLGDDVEVDKMLAGLEAAGPFIRRELGKILRLRRIPELRFVHDTTLDSALRIEEVLKEVLPETGPESASDPGADVRQPSGEGGEEEG